MPNKFARREILKRKLGLKQVPDKGKDKFIIIQIDALAYTLLQKLRKTNQMPFMKRLLHSYHVTKWDPGIPTNTHFVQASILYNDNSIIPGFKFFDKKKKKPYYMGTIEGAQQIEEQLAKRNEGILKGGTAIGLIFSGGANRSIFTLSQIYKQAGRTNTFGDLLDLLFLNPVVITRTMFYSLWEFLAEFVQSFTDIFRWLFKGKHFNWPFVRPYFPLYRMFMNTMAGEVTTEAALIELDRKVPYIYINYVGYDVASHNRGPEAISSLSVLRQIDSYVKKLYKKATEEGYDIYVISDHGQEPAVPFHKLFSEEFEEFVEREAKIGTKVIRQPENSMTKYFSHKIRFYYDHLSYPLRLITWFPLYLLGRAKKEEDSVKPVTIMYSSCLAQLYFTEYSERLNLTKIEKNYPKLIEKIVNHKGIGFVLAKEKNNVHVLNSKGKIIIGKNKVIKEGGKFLHIYGNEDRLIKQIYEFMKLSNNGDLIISGKFNGKEIIAFDHYHHGSHDGIGGAQHDAFFVSKEKIDLSHVINARELHHIFKRYHE